jgi:hypothetical protein
MAYPSEPVLLFIEVLHRHLMPRPACAHNAYRKGNITASSQQATDVIEAHAHTCKHCQRLMAGISGLN